MGSDMFMVMQNIHEGLFWFLIPVCLVICNDIMAYVFGKWQNFYYSYYSSLSLSLFIQVFSLVVLNLSISLPRRHGKDSLVLCFQQYCLDYWQGLFIFNVLLTCLFFLVCIHSCQVRLSLRKLLVI